MNELQTTNQNQLATISAEVAEQAIGLGDVSKLTAQQRVEYLAAVCRTLKLNPLTHPIRILPLGGKTVLYATKDCTDQLRMNHNISVKIVSRERMDDLLVVTAQATTPDGRTDEAVGAISVQNLKGESLANAIMKCESKAKRRVTLSICGLGLMDETEVESVQSAAAKPTAGMAAATITSALGKGKEALAQFEAMKSRIGVERYYEILGNEGFDEARDIKSRPDAERIYGLMELAASEVVDVG